MFSIYIYFCTSWWSLFVIVGTKPSYADDQMSQSYRNARTRSRLQARENTCEHSGFSLASDWLRIKYEVFKPITVITNNREVTLHYIEDRYSVQLKVYTGLSKISNLKQVDQLTHIRERLDASFHVVFLRP